MHVPVIILVLWALVFISLLVLTTLQYRHLVRGREGYAFLSELHDRTLLDMQRQNDAARAVVPYLAQTSTAMFYGEQEGVQYSFGQRQEIARKVQAQNNALIDFKRVFGISVMSETMARAATGDPVAKAAVEELGRDADLPPVSSSPWPVDPPRPEHHHPFA